MCSLCIIPTECFADIEILSERDASLQKDWTMGTWELKNEHVWRMKSETLAISAESFQVDEWLSPIHTASWTGHVWSIKHKVSKCEQMRSHHAEASISDLVGLWCLLKSCRIMQDVELPDLCNSRPLFGWKWLKCSRWPFLQARDKRKCGNELWIGQCHTIHKRCCFRGCAISIRSGGHQPNLGLHANTREPGQKENRRLFCSTLPSTTSHASMSILWPDLQRQKEDKQLCGFWHVLSSRPRTICNWANMLQIHCWVLNWLYCTSFAPATSWYSALCVCLLKARCGGSNCARKACCSSKVQQSLRS